MADKQAIINDVRKTYGNMLNITQAAKVFNCNRKTVPLYLKDLPYLQMGKEKKYLASDIGSLIYYRLEATI